MVVLNGRSYSIKTVRLMAGAIRIFWDMVGPMEMFESDLTVYGDDGIGCWQGSHWKLVSPIPDGTYLECGYEIKIDKIIDPHDFVFTGDGQINP